MRPVSYWQTDPRWRHRDYSAPGESTTIGASGCGPTAMAMVLATWCDPSVTPETECAWALRHGYKAPHSGTYYGYFVPAGERYGLTVTRLNWATLYGSAQSPCHAVARAAVDRGDLVIACMGKGNWTRSGHYVLVWKIQGNTVYINDPASTASRRVRGDYALFRSQVKYYWSITRPKAQKVPKPAPAESLEAGLTDEEAYALTEQARRWSAHVPEPTWSKAQGHWARAVRAGLVNGEAPEGAARRDEVIAILGRLHLF